MWSDITAKTTPHQALAMTQAFYAAMADAAYPRFAETWTRRLERRQRADSVLLNLAWDVEALLKATAEQEQTWLWGRFLYPAHVLQT
jgi:predicted amidohydrolase YtcJ